MKRKIYNDQPDPKEFRTIKQRDKIVIGVLLAIVGVLFFSMICNYAKADMWAESEAISEDTGMIEDYK